MDELQIQEKCKASCKMCTDGYFLTYVPRLPYLFKPTKNMKQLNAGTELTKMVEEGPDRSDAYAISEDVVIGIEATVENWDTGDVKIGLTRTNHRRGIDTKELGEFMVSFKDLQTK